MEPKFLSLYIETNLVPKIASCCYGDAIKRETFLYLCLGTLQDPVIIHVYSFFSDVFYKLLLNHV